MSDSVQHIRQRLLTAKLPAMPEILIKLIQLCQTEEAGMAELAALIAKDPAMASKVLGAANSALYSVGRRLPTLMQCLQTLGMATTKNLLICESVFQVFNGLTSTETKKLNGFWRHSLMTAMCARQIAAALSYPHLEEAYLAGLLHDIGRLALLGAAPKEYSALANHVDDASLCLAEERMFHIGHAEAGALLIQRWGLDSYLADSVLYHHQPAERAAATHPLIRIVILANALACEGPAATTVAQALCGMDGEALATILADAETQVRQAADMLKIDLAETEPTTSTLHPATPPVAANDADRQLATEVQQLVLNSTNSAFYSRPAELAGVLSAIKESAALLFGFDKVLMLLRDDAAQCLRGVATPSGRNDHAEFTMSLADGGAVSVSMSHGRVAFIESDSCLPRLTEEPKLLLEVANGRVRPNSKSDSLDPADFTNTPGDAAYPALTLAEEQLLRLLDAEYLACLPLLHDGQCSGVMIGTALDLQVSELHAREGFLLAFARQAAAAIEAARRREAEGRRNEELIAAEFRLASRQAVHEANNPLSIIKNYLAVLDNKVTRQESVSAEIATINGEIDRVDHILQDLARARPAPRDAMVEVDRIVGEVVKLYAASLPQSMPIRIATRLQGGKTQLKANADNLKQILLNLIKNAAEALPDAGEIIVSTHAPINRNGCLYYELSVQDNGPGIAPEVLSKLFSPMATSKPGKHMGLGLSIVHDLVRRLDGAITCRSSGEGTHFEILLPVAAAAPDEPTYLRSAD